MPMRQPGRVGVFDWYTEAIMTKHHRVPGALSFRPWRMLAGLAVPVILLAGCASSGVAVAPPDTNHPANPQAAAAPLPPRSTTLDPLPDSDVTEKAPMAAGDHMHQHH
jgi:hypothetical protein